jgi:outer membrane protein insertion porin family
VSSAANDGVNGNAWVARAGTFTRLRFWASLLLSVLLLTGLALAQNSVITEIIIHGNRRIPAETVKARMFSKAGDVYDQAALERDFNSLWNTGYFDDIRFEREETPKGWRVHVYVKEKPTIREIKYVGLNSISQSDVLDRFKERKVSLTQESQYDPTKVKKAEVVIKELLSEHGRQFSNIVTEIRPIPPAAVGVTFVVKEGPKVKVGRIRFEGNKKIKSRTLRASMKNLKPLGVPHSIFLENIFARTYNASRLSEDAERVRDAYQQKGYFKALIQDPQTKIRDTGGGFHIPLIQKGGGKVVDITIPIEEGERFHLKEVKFTGNKAVNNTPALRRLIPMKDGELFNVEMVRKGIKNLRDAYGELGYINFTPVPNTDIDDEHHLITLTFDLDEGKPFYVRRVEFKGNTTTRDKVIRRELAVEEGQVYNKKLWELSLLRLNQLGYFEPLKTEEQGGERSDEVKQNNQEGTVDITLKVKEKGKNSIGLSGGVSGLAGSFIGLSYETNNFLGLGETLNVTASVGSRQRNLMFGFTEPYMFDRPLQVGFTVFSQRFNFNQAQEASILSNQQLNLPENVLQSLQNFSQSRTGFTMSGSYPLKRSFKRIGLTYSFDTSSVTVFSQFSALYFQELNFRNISGPDSLKGIVTSKLLPSFTTNTIDNPMRPHRGRSLFIGGDIAGLGGNVSFVRPVLEYKRWTPMRGIKPNREGRNTFGFRIQASHVSGYLGRVAPPFERFFMGGDTDIRGFDIRAISPVAFFVERLDFPVTNPDGTSVLKDPNNPRQGVVTVPIPVHRIIFPGGDTQVIANAEYRIPIIGPVTLAPFLDAGIDAITRPSQLQVNAGQLNTLNTTAFGCPALDASFNCLGGVSQPFGKNLHIVSASNWRPRVSTGLELQVIMPVVNAPMRVYWAYNPLRLDTFTQTPNAITRSMFPPGGAGDFSFQQAVSNFALGWRLKEPSKTFRFTVATTF